MPALTTAMPVTLADSTVNQVSIILHALAPLLWPVVVIAAILLFQGPLRAAIGRVSEVDVGTAKVVLQKQADDTANTAKAAAGDGQDMPPPPAAITAAAAQATGDPAGSILTAWTAVEDAVRRPAAQQAPGTKTSPSVPQVVNTMTSSKGLDSSLVPVAKALESLRSVAAGQPEAISPATATSFVSAAGDLARLIAKFT